MPKPANVQQWNSEGNGFNTTVPTIAATALTCPPGTTAVRRAYNHAFPVAGPKNPWDSNHRFVRAQADIDNVVARCWRDEGIVFCAPDSPAIRMFAPSSTGWPDTALLRARTPRTATARAR